MSNRAIIMPINKKRVLLDGTVESDLWGIEISDDMQYAQTCIFQRHEIIGADPADLLDIAENRTNEIATEIIARAREGLGGIIISRVWHEFSELAPAPKAI